MLSVYIFGATVLVTEVSFLSRIFLGGVIYALHLWKDRSQAVTSVLVRLGCVLALPLEIMWPWASYFAISALISSGKWRKVVALW